MNNYRYDAIFWCCISLILVVTLLSSCATPDMNQDEVNAIVEILK